MTLGQGGYVAYYLLTGQIRITAIFWGIPIGLNGFDPEIDPLRRQARAEDRGGR